LIHSAGSTAAVLAPRVLLALGGGFLCAMGLVCVLVLKNASTDAAEQLLWTQTLQAGYGIQPPLYTWLQRLVFAVTGVNFPALVFTKELLLGLTGVMMFLAARRISRDETIAGLAVISFLLLPQFAYESQRDLSHSVLATMLAAATLWVVVRLVEEPRTWTYLLFGLVAALGLLAKYSYGFLLAGVLFAALSLPRFRVAFTDRRMGLTLVVFLAALTPHVAWLLSGLTPEMTTQASAKLNLGRETLSLARSAGSLLTLLKVTLAFVAPLGLVYGIAFFVRNRPATVEATAFPEAEQFLGRVLFVELALVAVLGAAGGVLGFKGRWMQPLLFFVPLYLLLRLRSRIHRRSVRRLLVVAGVCATASLTALGGRVLFADLFKEYTRFNTPFDALAGEIRARGFARGVILTDHHWTAGNLRLRFPESVVLTPGYKHLPFSRHAPALIVWQGESMPIDLAKLLPELGMDDWPAEQRYSVRLKYRYAGQASTTFTYALPPRKQ
jgi:lipopolysaccharide core galacturonosyltransferase RgtB